MDVIVDNTAFNKNYWAQFSEDEFISMNLLTGTYKQYSMADRIELLKHVYKLIAR